MQRERSLTRSAARRIVLPDRIHTRPPELSTTSHAEALVESKQQQQQLDSKSDGSLSLLLLLVILVLIFILILSCCHQFSTTSSSSSFGCSSSFLIVQGSEQRACGCSTILRRFECECRR